jgi:hypothetical protein
MHQHTASLTTPHGLCNAAGNYVHQAIYLTPGLWHMPRRLLFCGNKLLNTHHSRNVTNAPMLRSE